jgi:cysteine desulfurase / selenocysteine lyase
MDWQSLRSDFPITRRWAFFDHAAVAPLSARAQQGMLEWAVDLTENGDVYHGRWMKRIEEVRGLLGRLLNCDPLDLAFVKNTSEGVGIIAEGYPWQAGDNVVTVEDEYPANMYPWMNLASRGVELRRVGNRQGRILIDDLRKAMDDRTRILTISWVEFASGFRNDIDAIGALCRERNILFFLDAIQGLGVFPIDLQQSPIDFLAADGHKWLLGPEGAGILYVRRDLVERLHPVGVGWNSVVGAKDFSRIRFELKPNAGRWESGTLNVAGITALGASLELMLDIGIERIAKRVLELTDYLCRQVQSFAGLTLYGSRAQGEASGIVSFAIPDAQELPTLVAACKSAGIVVNQRGGRLRVSPHFYNSVEELDKLVVCLKERLK